MRNFEKQAAAGRKIMEKHIHYDIYPGELQQLFESAKGKEGIEALYEIAINAFYSGVNVGCRIKM